MVLIQVTVAYICYLALHTCSLVNIVDDVPHALHKGGWVYIAIWGPHIKQLFRYVEKAGVDVRSISQ